MVKMRLKFYVLSTISGFFGAAFLLASYIVVFPDKKIATINVAALVDDYLFEARYKDLTELEIKESSKMFMNSLQREIDILSKKKRMLFVVSDAVVAGCDDYTATIRARLWRKK